MTCDVYVYGVRACVYYVCMKVCARVQRDRQYMYVVMVVDLADDKMRNPVGATVPFRCVGFSGVRQ